MLNLQCSHDLTNEQWFYCIKRGWLFTVSFSQKATVCNGVNRFHSHKTVRTLPGCGAEKNIKDRSL